MSAALPSQAQTWTREAALAGARAALAQYTLRDPQVRFLGHSDNLTFRVEEPGGALYLLRLHRPALPYWAGLRQEPEVIASELTWLEALAWEGHFHVQHPLRTREGALVALVQAEAEPVPLPATLLTWLEGEHFSPAAPQAEAQVERFGALAAQLHTFSAGWNAPPGLIRPRYDAGHFNRIFARLLRGVNLGIFSEEVFRLLRAVRQAIQAEITAQAEEAQCWGMVHADLHVGNFLVHEEEIVPIDFSFCGFGAYLFDLSVCLAGGLKPALRPAFLRGYRTVRPLPENDLRTVTAYALAGRLSYYAYQVDNPAERDWLRRRIPEVAQNEGRRFLDGDDILWSL
jgi:Ser/Thr protein kinase RdoA (MazF antagonist)